ncbi:MAG: alanyl-tRNA editing protein [Candidatus Promineifilaceae bacterium]
MNQRRYYEDSYTASFEASIVESVVIDGQPGVVLEETYFYPSSGGQPHDTGIIGDAAVVDVVVRPADEAVVHVLSTPVRSVRSQAKIDWARRFDHMQQHTGQHILSQAFLRILEAQTLSFHMGADVSSVDIDIQILDRKDADSVEMLANEIVWANRSVRAELVRREEALQYPMRKPPPTLSKTLRLVTINDFDASACGGTHVSSTGEIGLIKIIGWERKRNAVRVEFLCGGRALADYGEKNEILQQLSARFTTGFRELPGTVRKLNDELSEQRKLNKRIEKELLEFEAAALVDKAVPGSTGGFIVQIFHDKSPNELRALANHLKSNDGLTVLFASIAARTHLLFAKNESVAGDMSQLLNNILRQLGSGSGGGSELYAQGTTDVFDFETLQAALKAAAVELEQFDK